MGAFLRRGAVPLAVLATGFCLHAQQLPLRRYTTAEGLPSNAVYSIAPDSRGFLWFATAEGLTRFDGSGFTAQIAGLPHGPIRQVLIGHHGNYWLATAAGVIRFRPDLPPSNADRVVVVRPNGQPESSEIETLFEDRTGKLWCGTEAGLFQIDDTSAAGPNISEVQVAWAGKAPDNSEVTALAEDTEGAMWIGTGDGTLYRRLTDGRTERYPATEALPQALITFLKADRTGRSLEWAGPTGSNDLAPLPIPAGMDSNSCPVVTERRPRAGSSISSNRTTAIPGSLFIETSSSFPRAEDRRASGTRTMACPAVVSAASDRIGMAICGWERATRAA